MYLSLEDAKSQLRIPDVKVLFAASEAAPLIKTGGLADVAGSLPAELRMLDLDVRLILPAYPDALTGLDSVEEASRVRVHPGDHEVRLLTGRLKHNGLPVLLVDHRGFFERPGNPYTGPDGHDWADNPERFALFCRAIAMVARDHAGLDWLPDVVHCNDWQTGLVPPLLAADGPKRARTLFTIHNLAYQGNYSKWVFEQLQLPWDWWRIEALEFHGNFSFIKGGIVYADRINTVSPTYAQEILTAAGGHGLDGALREHRDRLSGILNGIDYRVWNPAADDHIEQHYDGTSFALKARNKAALQRQMGLEENPEAMLIGHIGRMVHQKGVDLILEILPRLMAEKDTQIVILGSGVHGIEREAQEAAARYPGRMGLKIGYDEGLSHLIEAGADAFVMPSRFEPCGLNQIYSLRYGTVPIVHNVGGLADTVIDANPATMLDDSATGFVFTGHDADSLWEAVNRALHFYHRPGIWWEKLAVNGMTQDFSWAASARHYRDLYRQMVDA